MKLEIFTLCKNAISEGGLLQLYDVCDGLFAEKAPLKTGRLCVVFRIRFKEHEAGEHAIRLSLMDEDGDHIIPEFNKIIVARPMTGFNNCTNIGIAAFSGIIFPKFGEYSLDLFVDENPLGSQPLYFQKCALTT